MPDSNGRILGIAVPASSAWPPARPTPGGYIPEDEYADAEREGMKLDDEARPDA